MGTAVSDDVHTQGCQFFQSVRDVATIGVAAITLDDGDVVDELGPGEWDVGLALVARKEA